MTTSLIALALASLLAAGQALAQAKFVEPPMFEDDVKAGRLPPVAKRLPETPLVALAFECQIFPEIPTQPHDIFMDKIITEKTIYQGRGRAGK